MKFSSITIGCFALLLAAKTSALATVLYNLDFTSPEIGTYQTVFGNPTVQSSVGPFTDALVFHAVTTYDQIELPINTVGAHYDVQCDLLVHNLLNSQYGFAVILDTPEVRTLEINGLTNTIYTYQPFGGATIGAFANDTVYHFGLAVDIPTNLWTVSVNGVQKYSGALNATQLQDIRFDLSPTYGGAANAPTIYGALDNVLVTVVPEPGTVRWSSCAALVGCALAIRRRRCRGAV